VPVQVGGLREVLAQEAVRVLVRPALPRAVRIAEVDCEPGIDAKPRVLSHRHPLVPGKRLTEPCRQRANCRGDLVADGLGAVASERWSVLLARLPTVAVHWRQVQEHREPGGALHEGTDRGLVEPDDQVAFPVARDRPIRDFGWTSVLKCSDDRLTSPHIYLCGTPSAWRTRGSARPLGASGTRTITPSPNR
jgi:hypothetical protein